jgi:hypothetical protein
MSSRVAIQQTVSTYAPAGAVLGDEWINPTTGVLSKRTIVNGVVNWVALVTGTGTVAVSGGGGSLSAQYFGANLGSVTTLNFATGTTATLVSGTLTLQSAIRPNLLSYTTVSAISPTATTDMITISVLAATLTINSVSGSLQDGQKLLLRIKDNGSAQTLSWNAIYRAVGADIPGSTVASKWMYVGVIYNLVGTGSDAAPNSRWDVVSLNIEV